MTATGFPAGAAAGASLGAAPCPGLPAVRELDDFRRRENFPVALGFLPRRHRQPLVAIYRLARLIDQIGDELHGDRMAALDALAAHLRAAARGADVPHPAVAQAARYVRDGRLPLQPFLDLIEANRRDQTVRRYATWEDLLDYCRLSANPVGRLVLAVFAAATPPHQRWSDDVCTALQVIEHCQDVGEDARRGRVYLPEEDLRMHGCRDADLLAPRAGAALRRVIALQTARARELLASGRPLVRSLRGWARLAVAGYVAGGIAAADAIERAGFDVLAAPVRPGRARTAAEAARLLATALGREAEST